MIFIFTTALCHLVKFSPCSVFRHHRLSQQLNHLVSRADNLQVNLLLTPLLNQQGNHLGSPQVNLHASRSAAQQLNLPEIRRPSQALAQLFSLPLGLLLNLQEIQPLNRQLSRQANQHDDHLHSRRISLQVDPPVNQVDDHRVLRHPAPLVNPPDNHPVNHPRNLLLSLQGCRQDSPVHSHRISLLVLRPASHR